MKETDGDFWSADYFTDQVTAAFIAMYESEIDPDMGGPGHGPARINAADLARVRRHGMLIPAGDRVILAEGYVGISRNDAPMSACVAMGSHRANGRDMVESYCRVQFCKRIDRLPPQIRRTSMGIAYEMISLWPQDTGGVIGLRSFLVLRADGTAQLQRGPWDDRDSEEYKLEVALTGTLQHQSEIRQQWTVTAEDGNSKVTVGAYPESIKSVLYARSLPLTESGRKRPILHLVNAHKRRMASGIEIDIAEFLRGTRLVEMGGIQFRVSASRELQESLAKRRSEA